MPRVLIIGATGYIGSALATSLLRSGQYVVYGLARTPEKAKKLAAHEILPVIGSANDSDAYIDLIKNKHIDVIVDCAGANQESKNILSDLVSAGKERLKEGGAKLGFVYTSGTWVHGSSYQHVNDLDPVGIANSKTQPPSLVAWRPELERNVLAARDVLDTMIVRPALVYGRQHAIWSSFFNPIIEATKNGSDTVQIPLDDQTTPGLIHVDDVASGLHCAVEKLPLISGTGVHPIFDLVTSVEPMSLVFHRFGEIVGFQGNIKLIGHGGNPFAEAMSTSINADSARAKQLLGWSPKRLGFVAGMEIYANAFLSSDVAEF